MRRLHSSHGRGALVLAVAVAAGVALAACAQPAGPGGGPGAGGGGSRPPGSTASGPGATGSGPVATGSGPGSASPHAGSAPPGAGPSATARPVPTGTTPSGVPSGFPTAATTGVRPGAKLTVVDRDQVITAAGTVFENKDVRGCITVKADNVVIRNVKVACDTNVAVIVNNGRNLLVEDTTIVGLGSGGNGIASTNFTARRVDVSGGSDGVRLGSNVVLEDSYLHDQRFGGGCHCDATQSYGDVDNVLVRHNTLLVHPQGNAAYQFGTGVKTRIRFHGNYLAGGGYLLNGGAGSGGTVEFRGNVFGPSRYGAHVFRGGTIVFDASNVWAANGKPVPR